MLLSEYAAISCYLIGPYAALLVIRKTNIFRLNSDTLSVSSVDISQVYQIQERGLLEDEGRDADDEIPLTGLVSESKHARVHPDAAEHRRHEEE